MFVHIKEKNKALESHIFFPPKWKAVLTKRQNTKGATCKQQKRIGAYMVYKEFISYIKL